MPIPFDSIAQLQKAYSVGQISPRDVVQDCLQAMDRYEADLQAWVRVDRESALSLATEQNNLLGKSNLPPLVGIPLGIKDIIDVAGYPSLGGSAMRMKDNPPPITLQQEAPVVTRLREAGAILLGKTVTTEFACFDPAPTSNPWNLSHTPGGSSSGTAAAVASGMCLAALGTQTGGSILRPASYCGVVGYKPAYDLSTLQGIFPVSHRLDHVGPFTRCVEDAWRIQQVMVGKSASIVPSSKPSRSLQLLLLEELYADSLVAEDAAQFAAMVATVESTGASIYRGSVCIDWQSVRATHRQIMALDAYQVHSSRWPDRFGELGPQIQGLLEEGRELAKKGAEFSQALSNQQGIFTQFLRHYIGQADAILIPSTPAPAPASKTTTGDPQYNSPFSLAGLPAITIPYAISKDGLPLGLQLVSADEQHLWPAALALEEMLGVSFFAAKHSPRK